MDETYSPESRSLGLINESMMQGKNKNHFIKITQVSLTLLTKKNQNTLDLSLIHTKNKVRDKPPIPLKLTSTNVLQNNLRIAAVSNRTQKQYVTSKQQFSQHTVDSYEADENAGDFGETTVDSIKFDDDQLKELNNDKEFTFDDSGDSDESDKENNFRPSEEIKIHEPPRTTKYTTLFSKYMSTSSYSDYRNSELTNVSANILLDLDNGDNSMLFSRKQSSSESSDQTVNKNKLEKNEKESILKFFYLNSKTYQEIKT